MERDVGLADCHTHIDSFGDELIPGILERAERAGVGRIIAAGIDLASSRRAVNLACRYATLLAGIGVHPLHLPERLDEGDCAAAAELALSCDRVVAISEVGLDFVDGAANRDQQIAVFRRFVRLAIQLRRPIVFHNRGADDEIFTILAEEGAGSTGKAMHYFSGNADRARRCLANGCYISVGKPVLKPENGALREAIKLIPLDRLLLETDAYFRPERAAGEQTEPWQVSLVAAAVAEVKGITPGTVAAATDANLDRLLRNE